MNISLRSILGALSCAAFAFGGVSLAYAQETSTDDAVSVSVEVEADSKLRAVTFPIAELGNCTDKASCKAYCDDSENHDACMAFAEARGFVKKEQAEKYRSFAAIVKDKGGPGGCTNHKECRAYCSTAEHADECIAFAEKVGELKGEDLARAKKMAQAMKERNTPGGCNSQESCRAYCSTEEHASECIAFAEKHNFASQKELALMRKIANEGGPGGCKSPRECAAFCNQKGNTEACFAFAKEHGLISEEQVTRIKEGVAHVRIGIADAPPEIRTCLKAHVSDEQLAQIEAGNFAPSSELGEKMRGCFERNASAMKKRLESQFKNPSEDLRRCIAEATGNTTGVDSLVRGEVPKTPETAEKIRACVEQFRPALTRPASDRPQSNSRRGDSAFSVPEHLRACLEAKGHAEALRLAVSGEASPEVVAKIRMALEECVRASAPSLNTRPNPGTQTRTREDRFSACLMKLYGVKTAAEARSQGITLEGNTELEACVKL